MIFHNRKNNFRHFAPGEVAFSSVLSQKRVARQNIHKAIKGNCLAEKTGQLICLGGWSFRKNEIDARV